MSQQKRRHTPAHARKSRSAESAVTQPDSVPPRRPFRFTLSRHLGVTRSSGVPLSAPFGFRITPESLVVSGRCFTGKVKDTAVEGVFEIGHRWNHGPMYRGSSVERS